MMFLEIFCIFVIENLIFTSYCFNTTKLGEIFQTSKRCG